MINDLTNRKLWNKMLIKTETSKKLTFQSPAVLKVKQTQPIVQLEIPSRKVLVDDVPVSLEALFKSRDIWRNSKNLLSMNGCSIDLTLRGDGFSVRTYSYKNDDGSFIKYTDTLNNIKLDRLDDKGDYITIYNTTEHGNPDQKGFLEYFLDTVDEIELRIEDESKLEELNKATDKSQTNR